MPAWKRYHECSPMGCRAGRAVWPPAACSRHGPVHAPRAPQPEGNGAEPPGTRTRNQL